MTLDRADIEAIAAEMAPMLARMLGVVLPSAQPGGVEEWRLRKEVDADLQACRQRKLDREAKKGAKNESVNCNR